jgi:hypothetical protein
LLVADPRDLAEGAFATAKAALEGACAEFLPDLERGLPEKVGEVTTALREGAERSVEGEHQRMVKAAFALVLRQVRDLARRVKRSARTSSDCEHKA